MNYELRIKNVYLFLILIFLILLDQLSKYLIRSQGGFYICNKGIAFGLQLPFWVYAIFLAVFLIVILLNLKFQISNLAYRQAGSKINSKLEFQNSKFKIQNFCKSPLIHYSLFIILIIAGAISNLIDRLRFGCVIDFIDLKVWPVFNLADAFITLGALFILLSLLKKQKNKDV